MLKHCVNTQLIPEDPHLLKAVPSAGQPGMILGFSVN